MLSVGPSETPPACSASFSSAEPWRDAARQRQTAQGAGASRLTRRCLWYAALNRAPFVLSHPLLSPLRSPSAPRNGPGDTRNRLNPEGGKPPRGGLQRERVHRAAGWDAASTPRGPFWTGLGVSVETPGKPRTGCTSPGCLGVSCSFCMAGGKSALVPRSPTSPASPRYERGPCSIQDMATATGGNKHE